MLCCILIMIMISHISTSISVFKSYTSKFDVKYQCQIYNILFSYLKPHYKNSLLTLLLQLCTLCFNHWEPQQLTASQICALFMSLLPRLKCDMRLTERNATDIVQYFWSRKNNHQILSYKILKVTKCSWKSY